MLLSDVCLTSVCLYVPYIGPKSRTERPRKTKIGTDVVHVTRESDTTFDVKRSKVKDTRPLYSPPCWRVRRLHAAVNVRTCWPWETAVCSVAEGASAPTGGREGRGIPWRPPAYSLVTHGTMKTEPALGVRDSLE